MISNPFTPLEQKIESLHFQIESLRSLLQQYLECTRREDLSSQETGGIDLAITMTGLARGTIYNLITNRRIPHYKKGGRIYFLRDEIDSWIRQGKRNTIGNLER